MKKIARILLLTVIICISSLINVYAKEISIEDIHQDKSKVILKNDEIIPEETNILLIHKKGEIIISVPKEAEEDFKYDYKIIGYEKDNNYYIYSNANNLIENICEINIEKDKKIKITMYIKVIVFIIVGLFALIILNFIKTDDFFILSIPGIIMFVIIFIVGYIANNIIVDNIELKAIEKIEKQITIYGQ